MNVIGTKVDTRDYDSACRIILSWAQAGESRYICAANVHMVMEAYDSEDFARVVNESDMTVPDGMPLVWMLRLKGGRHQARVYGPSLMLKLLERAAKEGVGVGFFGAAPDVLRALVEAMQTRYAGLNVAFSMSPPFRELTPGEEDELADRINQSGVGILFVGLGCPKQEVWMAAHRTRIHAVMIGVGAAFDFHAGAKPQAFAWMQRLGLEWLFRLVQEPRRLWRRYLIHNPRFAVLALADLLGLLRD